MGNCIFCNRFNKYKQKQNQKITEITGPFTVASRRSTVLSCNAAVATSNPIASDVGLQILRTGVNAADAAVGVAATLNLVEPEMTGFGGDCFCLFYNSSTKGVEDINGR